MEPVSTNGRPVNRLVSMKWLVLLNRRQCPLIPKVNKGNESSSSEKIFKNEKRQAGTYINIGNWEYSFPIGDSTLKPIIIHSSRQCD